VTTWVGIAAQATTFMRLSFATSTQAAVIKLQLHQRQNELARMINQSEARPLSRSLAHVCIVRYTIERSLGDRRDHQEPSLLSSSAKTRSVTGSHGKSQSGRRIATRLNFLSTHSLTSSSAPPTPTSSDPGFWLTSEPQDRAYPEDNPS